MDALNALRAIAKARTNKEPPLFARPVRWRGAAVFIACYPGGYVTIPGRGEPALIPAPEELDGEWDVIDGPTLDREQYEHYVVNNPQRSA